MYILIFKNTYVGVCYFRVSVCGHMFMCVCGDWRRISGVFLNHLLPLFLFVVVVLRQWLSLSLVLAGGQE